MVSFCPVSADLLPALPPPHLPSHVPGHPHHVQDVQPANPEIFSLKPVFRRLRLDLRHSLSSLAGGRWDDAVRDAASRRALLLLRLLLPSHLVPTPTSYRSSGGSANLCAAGHVPITRFICLFKIQGRCMWRLEKRELSDISSFDCILVTTGEKF